MRNEVPQYNSNAEATQVAPVEERKTLRLDTLLQQAVKAWEGETRLFNSFDDLQLMPDNAIAVVHSNFGSTVVLPAAVIEQAGANPEEVLAHLKARESQFYDEKDQAAVAAAQDFPGVGYDYKEQQFSYCGYDIPNSFKASIDAMPQFIESFIERTDVRVANKIDKIERNLRGLEVFGEGMPAFRRSRILSENLNRLKSLQTNLPASSPHKSKVLTLINSSESIQVASL